MEGCQCERVGEDDSSPDLVTLAFGDSSLPGLMFVPIVLLAVGFVGYTLNDRERFGLHPEVIGLTIAPTYVRFGRRRDDGGGCACTRTDPRSALHRTGSPRGLRIRRARGIPRRGRPATGGHRHGHPLGHGTVVAQVPARTAHRSVHLPGDGPTSTLDPGRSDGNDPDPRHAGLRTRPRRESHAPDHARVREQSLLRSSGRQHRCVGG